MTKRCRIMIVGGLLLLPTAGVAVAQTQPGTGNPITCNGGRCEGTEQKDTIVASNGSEEIFGKGGDDDIELDAVFAGGSADFADGGEGQDCIDGGGGDDVMLGGPGDDNRPCEFSAFVNPRSAMTGGPGKDTIDGGPGNDTLDGIFDDDTLIGGEGDDILDDPEPLDQDRFSGGAGDDTLSATDTDDGDFVDGGPGNDECNGDPGDTFVNCETGTGPGPNPGPESAPAGTPPGTSPASGDTTRPRVRVRVVPHRRCVRRAFRVRVTVRDAGGIARTTVSRRSRVLVVRRFGETTAVSFDVRVRVAGRRVRRHRIAVTARDKAGNRRTVRRTFRRCAVRPG